MTARPHRPCRGVERVRRVRGPAVDGMCPPLARARPSTGTGTRHGPAVADTTDFTPARRRAAGTGAGSAGES
ncbi:hypothetical protein RKD24_006442 [Streptomyces calvus]